MDLEKTLDFASLLLKRFVLKEFTVCLLLVVIGYVFIPNEWDLFLISKTPESFPDFLTLTDCTVLAFSLLGTIVFQTIKSTRTINKRKSIFKHKHDKLSLAINQLNESELLIIAQFANAHFYPILLKSDDTVFALVAKEIIELAESPRCAWDTIDRRQYQLTAQAKRIIISRKLL